MVSVLSFSRRSARSEERERHLSGLFDRDTSAPVGARDPQAILRAATQPAVGLLDRIDAILPQIARDWREAETLRRPTDASIAALEETGVFRALVPQKFGGYGIDIEDFVEIGARVGAACVSTAWVTTFYIEHNHLFSLFSEDYQQEVFKNAPYSLMAGTVNPRGRGKPVDGGFAVTGRWPFASGVSHADQVALAGLVEGDPPGVRQIFMFPIDDVHVLDTWRVAGMSGTGSHDVAVESAFVPHWRMSDPNPPPSDYPVPVPPLLPLAAAAPALGGARRALALFRETSRTRKSPMTGVAQAEQPATRSRMALAAMQVRSAERTLMAIAAELTRTARRGAGKSPRDVVVEPLLAAEMRLETTLAVRACRDAVHSLLEGSGASAHYLDSEIQRIFRDLNVICAHMAFDVEGASEALGKELLA